MFNSARIFYILDAAALALLSALQANAQPYYAKPDTCLCPPRYDPVCGSDGQLYDNECQLYCQNIGRRPTVIVECGKGCPCNEGCLCPAVYDPVCGSDGKTYGNSCELRCKNKVLVAQGKKKINQVSKGECPPRNRCGCLRNYDPVCGSDGITYANPCTLDCENYRREQNNLRLIWVVLNGVCPKIENCFCTTDYAPVCGSNNRTYGNECKLFCERKPGLTVECFKTCPCDEGCFCTKEYNPVCGSDGITYGNPCMFDCENKRLKSLGLKKIRQVNKGECPTDECNCSKEYIPVCGSNNITYNNKCELACENRHRKPPITASCGYACPCKKA